MLSSALEKIFNDITRFVLEARGEFPAIVGFGIGIGDDPKHLSFHVLTDRELSLGEQREFFQHLGKEFIKFEVVGDIVAQNTLSSENEHEAEKVEKEKKWHLSGEAYGRSFDAELELIRKRFVSVSRATVEKHLEIVRKTGDQEYRKLIESREESDFITNKGEKIKISPRYVGSVLGSDDDGRGNTICALIVDGKYAALALYNKTTKEIIAHEY